MSTEFEYRKMRCGVENRKNGNVLVVYFQPRGSGYTIIPELDISKIKPCDVATGREVRRALDKGIASRAFRGIY